MFCKSKMLAAVTVLLINFSVSLPSASAQAAAQTAPAAQRFVGAIKSINGNAIALTTDTGAEVSLIVAEGARLLRAAPGQQDLNDATPITLDSLQAGDRILVRCKIGDDGKMLVASSVIAMKQADVAEKRKKELQDWQHRGIGGLVKGVDAAAGAVTVSTMGAAGQTSLQVKSSKDTIVRRYSPDSVKFDDAKPSTLAEIKPGDQLRARGAKNAEGTELAAVEIVSGAFRNIAGLVASIDAAKQTVTVNDLATKKPVVVRITAESQMHKIPPMVAQRLAMRVKGEAPEGAAAPGAAQAPGAARPAAAMSQSGEPGHAVMGGQGGPAGGGMRGAGDLQQMLARLPQMTFAELNKGDALMIVTTAGSATTDVTAITLLSGVEPILTASPNGSGAASLLTPWNLSGGAEQGAQ